MEKWQKQFYNSRLWKKTRLLVLLRNKYVCAECGEIIIDTPEVHHTIHLTQENYRNPKISLNLDLLISLHHDCHDKVHNRFGKGEKETIVNDDLEINYEMR